MLSTGQVPALGTHTSAPFAAASMSSARVEDCRATKKALEHTSSSSAIGAGAKNGSVRAFSNIWISNVGDGGWVEGAVVGGGEEEEEEEEDSKCRAAARIPLIFL
jgi:hypothetical protein